MSTTTKTSRTAATARWLIADGKVVGVELLHAADSVPYLAKAAKAYDLDLTALEAAAASAFAAPDQAVRVELIPPT